ncbi:MAG: hypothetical protein MHM6MM_005505 [Cercozoa sp. M6MM]
MRLLQWQSRCDAEFWQSLSRHKVAEARLSDAPVPIVGRFAAAQHTTRKTSTAPTLNFAGDSFNCAGATPSSLLDVGDFECHGTLQNLNTLSEFKTSDGLKKWWQGLGSLVKADIQSGRMLSEPEKLLQVHIRCHADLKKHVFSYWIGAPAVSPPASKVSVSEERPWVVGEVEAAYAIAALTPSVPFFVKVGEEYHNLSEWFQFADSFDQIPSVAFGYVEPSNQRSWPLRNLITALAAHCSTFRVIALRGFRPREPVREQTFQGSTTFTVTVDDFDLEEVKLAGLERDVSGKIKPRQVNLASQLDHATLSAQASVLNLQLMRWRLAPQLDLSRIAEAKCLILGCGTLGCAVSRLLVGWGVRHLTLVDNGKVSFSNPARQSLFTAADVHRYKAEAAKDALHKILPKGLFVDSHVLSIPMPGHIAELEAVRQLRELVDRSDAVFVLTDSRESRWLPALMSAAHSKICINTALGFDSYVVMRHGMPDAPSPVGCYFCNDVTAPQDVPVSPHPLPSGLSCTGCVRQSLRDRTLDQQCTVTRPGMAPLASAQAVELFVNILQHPDGPYAPAEESKQLHEGYHGPGLGTVSHQLRGSVSAMSLNAFALPRISCCTACGDHVLRMVSNTA